MEVVSVDESVPWLTQALCVFHAHNISLDEDLSNYKLLFSSLEFTGTLQKSKRKHQRRQLLCTPIYLIFLPSLHPVYHWSLDPIGQTPLSQDTCKYLGLPFKLSLKVTASQICWPTKIYKAIHDYQIMRGFDPKTTDFVQSFNFPIFDIVPTENRFQEIVEEPQEISAESDDVPFLPMVKKDSEFPGSNAHVDYVEDQSPEELDDSFSLDSLFYEIEGPANKSWPSGDVGSARPGSANSTYTQQHTMRSILNTLFAPLTWEAIEGSDISAAVI
ncbi:hypothetical protein E1B28_011746 [Marasmius oreades]|uniref:Uncharacterized protein n=1 Tax=Marasmius oreades TaxID=181124 RepID=A0A9P7UQA2_9AGAR|nr:uncharacterized protein E1B28_011746 [Marasmius oreades]KAG7090138.1 hypothetical protein E1B28_011746 [Marasmius oreades]